MSARSGGSKGMTASSPFSVRPFSPPDLEAVLQLQSGISSSPTWTGEDYLELAGKGVLLVAETRSDPPVVAGFAAWRLAAGEAELLNLAVAPAFRRQGAGQTLMQASLEALQLRHSTSLYLEVRPSNLPAIALYKKWNFNLLHVRLNYYRNPIENAWIMHRLLIG